MKSRLALVVLAVLSFRLFAFGQEPASNTTSEHASIASAVPHLIRFSGVVKDPELKPFTTLGITFLLYKDQQGGAPSWMETQNVQPDANGHYSVQLGSTQLDGVPLDLFSSGEARWLGVQVQGQAEQPRVLLLSVPYALKAADAETLGGKPLSAFQLAAPQTKDASSTSTGNGRSAQAAAEQPNEIRCTGSTGCSAGFIPKFATNGGSATVSNSIVSQSGSKVSVAGTVAAHTGSFSQASSNPILTVTNSGTGDAAYFVGGYDAAEFFGGSGGGIYADTHQDANLIAAVYANGWGSTKTTIGVNGFSASPLGYGVYGHDVSSSASGQTVGSGAGVWGDSSSKVGVIGTSDSDSGVFGVSGSGRAVEGASNTGIAIFGQNSASGSASAFNATMLLTSFSSTPQFVIYAEDTFGAHYVRTDNLGDLLATGSISGASKNFKIDHPLDPTGKYLVHTDIESPDMKNFYDGVAVLNGNGEAWIELPGYFESLNQDFRYQLTAIGASQPGLYVAEEISENRFRIAGGKASAKVSWQVTGIRHDKWADAHRSPVEVEKTAAEQGRYLHPEAFGKPAEQSVSYNGGASRPKLPDIRRKGLNEMHPVTPLGKPETKE